MSNLIKINPSEYGLTETKAQEIEQMFKPMLEKMSELEKEYNDIIKLPITETTCQLAKELRLKYVKVRTGTAAIHKDLKAFYLNGGRFVDGWKNAQLFASQGIEEKLESIEQHFIIIERERIAKLESERIELLKPYSDVMPQGLGLMDEQVFQNYLTGAKTTYEARIEAERKAEADRLAAIEAERIERERIRVENERLKAEAIEREKAAEAERKRQAAILEAERKEAEAKQRAIEEQARKEREAAEAEQRKLRAELEAKAEAERKAKAEQERIEREKRLAEAKAAKAPIKEKLTVWVNTLPACPDGNQDVAAKFAAFKTWVLSQIEQM